MEEAVKKRTPDPRDKWIPRYFVIFFIVLACLDSIFVYLAVSTQTGLVTEKPYEKGLAFDSILNKAKNQPALDHRVSYENGALRWGLPVENATVTAAIIRPVQAGYDFEIELIYMGSGLYEAQPQVPLPGAWTAHLKAIWDNTEFQTTHNFLAQ